MCNTCRADISKRIIMRGGFHNMKMSTKLRWSFGLIIGFMLCIAALTQFYLAGMADQWRKIEQQIMVRQDADLEIYRYLGDGISHFKNFILREEDYETKFRNDMSQLLKAVDKYEKAREVT